MNDSSHRDSPLGRYVGPVREVFSGDPRLGMAYIPMGRKLLGYLKNTLGAGRIEVGTQRLALPDGARLAAHVDGVNHILHIDVRDVVSGFEKELAIFVETGWIPLENLSGGEAPLTSSPLYYGARQYAALAQDFPQWLDEIIFTLDESDDVVGERAGLVRVPHPPTLPNYPPESLIDSIGFQTFERYDGEGRPDFVYTRTPAGQTPNPGYATGKLKLYLQSLLGGIGNKSFVLDDPEKVDPRSQHVTEIVTGIMGDYWAHINPGIAFNWDFSRGLFTSDDYQYWIITIQDRSVFAQKIRFLTQHQIFRRAYLKILRDPETPYAERTKIESYLLSGGIRFGAQFVVAENLLADFEGSPLHEGWKFNYRGTDAQIVTKEVNWEVNEANGINTIVNHTFRRYHLHIQYNAENSENPFSTTIEKLEEVDGTPEEKCLVPVRRGVSAGHLFEWEDWHEILIGQSRGYLDGYIEYDVPLYCWYALDAEGHESFVTVRDVVQWGTGGIDPVALYNDFIAPDGSFYTCGAGEVHAQNVRFIDTVDEKRGYYLRIESGGNYGIHEDLLTRPDFYTTFAELVEGRVAAVVREQTHWTAPNIFGGYQNLGFAPERLNCSGETESFDLPAGWDRVEIDSDKGTVETLKHGYSGDIIIRHVLVFPYNDGESVYIQRNEYCDGNVGIGYHYGSGFAFNWYGTAVSNTGETQSQNVDYRFYVNFSAAYIVSNSTPPQYPDMRFYLPYFGDTGSWSYDAHWAQGTDRRRFYYASSRSSELAFDETATITSIKDYNSPMGIQFHWTFPQEGIETHYCFGKHEWYVEISQDWYWPWFDYLTPLLQSYLGDAFYLQQWGPFEDHEMMPHEPIYATTDEQYPVMSSTDGLLIDAGIRQFDSVFTGWA